MELADKQANLSKLTPHINLKYRWSSATSDEIIPSTHPNLFYYIGLG